MLIPAQHHGSTKPDRIFPQAKTMSPLDKIFHVIDSYVTWFIIELNNQSNNKTTAIKQQQQ